MYIIGRKVFHPWDTWDTFAVAFKVFYALSKGTVSPESCLSYAYKHVQQALVSRHEVVSDFLTLQLICYNFLKLIHKKEK
jgi:hypothetical protein